MSAPMIYQRRVLIVEVILFFVGPLFFYGLYGCHHTGVGCGHLISYLPQGSNAQNAQQRCALRGKNITTFPAPASLPLFS